MYESRRFSKWKPHLNCLSSALFTETGLRDVRKQAIMAASVFEILPNNRSSSCFFSA
jgi:hypothetical protein